MGLGSFARWPGILWPAGILLLGVGMWVADVVGDWGMTSAADVTIVAGAAILIVATGFGSFWLATRIDRAVAETTAQGPPAARP